MARWWRSWLWMAPLGAVAILAALSRFETGPTLCPFALVTGMACPGCGLTRAAASLAQGDLVAAVTYHPLVLVAATWMAGWWGVAAARRWGRPITVDQRVVERLLRVTAGAFALTWVVRITTDSLPPV